MIRRRQPRQNPLSLERVSNISTGQPADRSGIGLQTRLQGNVGGACRAGHALWVWIRRIKGERFRVNEFAGLQDLTPATSGFGGPKRGMSHLMSELLFEEALKGAPIVAVLELTISEAIESFVNNPGVCLTDSQRTMMKQAVAQLNWLSRVGFVPSAPGVTIDIAVMAGWYILAAELYNYVKINRALEDC